MQDLNRNLRLHKKWTSLTNVVNAIQDKLARQLEAAAESLQNQADEVIAIKSSIGKINTAISSQKRTILSQNRKFVSKRQC